MNTPAKSMAQNSALQGQGFAFMSSQEWSALLKQSMGGSTAAPPADWFNFAASWNDLSVDTYMADGGRYRRRRFAAFEVSVQRIDRKPHQPHYQSRDYNPLNGGIERWFEPIAPAIAAHPVLLGCLRTCHSIFQPLSRNAPDRWHVEVHQFRIEARADQMGQPTPEGLHRDGVDWVLVLLVARTNVAEGVTTIYDLARHPLGSFTLTEPLDAALVDDSRVYHGVTAVSPLDPSRAGTRDVLVVTFRRP
jgi:hypothetical protein